MKVNPDEGAVLARLGELSDREVLAFGLMCMERLKKHYASFVRKEGWGDEDLMMTILDQLWLQAAGQSDLADELPSLRTKWEQAIPDSDDFPSGLASAAQSAAIAQAYVLDLALDRRREVIAEVVHHAVEAQRMLLPEASSQQDEREAIQAEVSAQMRDLNALRQVEGLREADVVALRGTASLPSPADKQRF